MPPTRACALLLMSPFQPPPQQAARVVRSRSTPLVLISSVLACNGVQRCVRLTATATASQMVRRCCPLFIVTSALLVLPTIAAQTKKIEHKIEHCGIDRGGLAMHPQLDHPRSAIIPPAASAHRRLIVTRVPHNDDPIPCQSAVDPSPAALLAAPPPQARSWVTPAATEHRCLPLLTRTRGSPLPSHLQPAASHRG